MTVEAVPVLFVAAVLRAATGNGSSASTTLVWPVSLTPSAAAEAPYVASADDDQGEEDELISLSSLPAAVQDAIRSVAGSSAIEELEKEVEAGCLHTRRSTGWMWRIRSRSASTASYWKSRRKWLPRACPPK